MVRPAIKVTETLKEAAGVAEAPVEVGQVVTRGVHVATAAAIHRVDTTAMAAATTAFTTLRAATIITGLQWL